MWQTTWSKFDFGHMITLHLANSLERKGFQKATREDQSIEPAEAGNETEIEQEVTRDAARDLMNTSFEELAVSPIKTHSLSKQRKISEAKSKIDKVCASIQERVASAINAESADLKHKDPHAKIPPLIQTKATDLDTLTYLMKENLKTLTPESWSHKQAAEFF